MNTRKVVSTITAMLLVAVFVLFATEASNAQGRYANRYSKRDVSRIISRLESSSDQFRRDFDRQMDRSNINGTPSEDQFNNLVSDFENSVDQLRREFDRNDTWWESRIDVQDMIRDARPVNQMMNNLPFRRNIERQWNRLRDDINNVADTYDLPGLNGGGWNGGGQDPDWGGGSGQKSPPPSWARGTFYSTDGSDIVLTIAGDGSVTVVNRGQTFYGNYYRETIDLNNNTSDVYRSGDGIRTYNRDTRQTTIYSRRSSGGTGGGQTSTPPSWARGTFYSTDGSNITLTIAENGNVTVINGGQTFYGTFYRNTILVNNDTSDLSRTGDGLRTYNRNTGQTTNYSRTGGGWTGGGGNVSRPPNWAEGTFDSINSSDRISITISSNGNITLINNGQTFYGTFYRDTMTVNGDTSTITRIRDGIRTYNQRTGQTTDYRRR